MFENREARRLRLAEGIDAQVARVFGVFDNLETVAAAAGASVAVGRPWAQAAQGDVEKLARGHCLLAVSTHALIEDAVTFRRMGLAIIDELHRFGVRQRLALRGKGESPHRLTNRWKSSES